MLINTQYEFEDYREANAWIAAEKKKTARRKPGTIILGLLLSLLTVFPALYAIGGFFESKSNGEWCFTFACTGWTAAMLFWPGLLFIITRRIGRTQLRNMWAGQPGLREPLTIQISGEGVIISSITQNTEYRWPAFLKYGESANLLLLYPSEFHFVMIRKRNLDVAQLVELRNLCQNLLGGGHRGFPVIPVPPPVIRR